LLNSLEDQASFVSSMTFCRKAALEAFTEGDGRDFVAESVLEREAETSSVFMIILADLPFLRLVMNHWFVNFVDLVHWIWCCCWGDCLLMGE